MKYDKQTFLRVEFHFIEEHDKRNIGFEMLLWKQIKFYK